ncbi:type IV pilus assembly protein PilC [Clostridium saccharoperbutylacetonicum]|uniref:Type IV pilus assembly protein TapC n=1 Tax=Clostridium saccharoperbutylacetonicum N1-4(HMT) TaxID=931276 RepID=M1N423_9CLOT|nr:type II secretion system F family protein [Clostridium saccharoperbutylacetonicum]AGF58202.1 type IV pilus assembly protein TapC [Clostridium saccharoperbutylacetonicum N1-4(HMT)]NRT61024.1 type IV pilus assembly protein PilC [Clostridium saccharoperbutylacetonicum]NSB24339.1 type IV pilus assembly protein PilC [Clostridium saccharoperbutylacetonicum]NSB43715.1 type IV pilus assembly protein PilC [Clostridium saccharoperbutylacetonicum]
MGKFKYRVMNSEGEKIEGQYEANSKDEVIAFISSNGYYPLMVEEVVQSANIELKLSKKVKLKDLSVFCRQFYTMLNAGVPILTCLDILANQIENQKLREATKAVNEEVEKGGVLSEAMRKHKEVFPELLVSLVASGEASGSLEAIMLRMSTHYEKENKINNKVTSALIYPIVLGFVSIAAVAFILVYVMPTFIDIFKQSGTELPWTTKFIMGISEGIQNYWFIIIAVIFIISFFLNIFRKTDEGILFFSKLRLKLPILKKLNQMLIVSRFTRTLSTLIASGLPLVEALNIVSTVTGNKVAEKALLRIRDNVMRGESLYASMVESNMFPPMLYSMIKIGEETGSLDDILNKTADFYDDELEAIIQASVAMLEPLLIVIMGLLIGFMVASIMIPMFDSYNQI